MSIVTVVGAGNGGCAIAATLAMKGHSVRLLKLSDSLHTEAFGRIQAESRIALTGIAGQGVFPLDMVTTDPGRAVHGAEIVLVVYVATYHPEVADRVASHLSKDQLVVLAPGYLGSLLLERAMKATGGGPSPLFAELETLPYSSRLSILGEVDICSLNVRHPFAAYPSSRNEEARQRMQPLLGECVPRRHLLEVALHNPNLVIHTAGVLLNAALVEKQDRGFAMYRDGFSPSIWRVVEALDAEKMDVLASLGARRIPYFDEFRLRTFDDTSIDGLQGFLRYAAEAPGGPYTVNNRYVTEDVPMGLGLLHSLGSARGIRTPVCDSLVNLANAMLAPLDFWKEARSIGTVWDGSLDELLGVLTGE